MASKVAAIDLRENFCKSKYRYDFALDAFAKGINKQLLPASQAVEKSIPLIARGMSASSGLWIHNSQNNNLPFYYIDSGYFGNQKKKLWHRVTYNELQNTKPIKQQNVERLEIQMQAQWKDIYNPITSGRKILICPPSKKVMSFFNQPGPEEWTSNIIKQLTQLTDRPIQVRLKPSRTDRQTVNSIRHTLEDDVHCLITYNSIAATEALIAGKPAITLGPNAAQNICETDIKNIENPKVPTKDEMFAFLTHLSYCQFTISEMKEGIHWKYLTN